MTPPPKSSVNPLELPNPARLHPRLTEGAPFAGRGTHWRLLSQALSATQSSGSSQVVRQLPFLQRKGLQGRGSPSTPCAVSSSRQVADGSQRPS